MPHPDERVLVIAQAWVGDVTLSQMLYAQLKEERPQVSIDVVAPAWAQALLHRMPQVDRHIVHDIPHGRLRPFAQWTQARHLRGQYSQAIIIPRSTKSALLPLLAGIPKRTGFASSHRRFGMINDRRERRPDGSVARMLTLASPSACKPSPSSWPRLNTDPVQADRLKRQYDLDPQARWIGLMPGTAFGGLKQWGIDSFRQLAGLLTEQHYRVCLLGSAQDRAIGQRIREGAEDHIINLCGSTSLDDAIDLISALECAICNDSGLMHIAAAVGTPVVGIYGPTSPLTHPPLSPTAAICSARTLCSPCHRERATCPYGHHRCMTSITAEQVCREACALIQ